MSASVHNNPWIKEGVSVLRQETKDLLPIVGQRDLFTRLQQFCADCITESSPKLTGFFVLYGAWGVGKSRVGHEICLEALFDEVQWILDGTPGRVLQPGLTQGLLPIFVRYIQ